MKSLGFETEFRRREGRGITSIFVLDEKACDRLLAERRVMGGDLYDEVWEGTYVMALLASIEHQRLVLEPSGILREVIQRTGKGGVFPGANVTDLEDDWEHNYRCPDVVVLLKDNPAKVIEAAIVGGPDFLIEIMSPRDRTPDKLPFLRRSAYRNC